MWFVFFLHHTNTLETRKKYVILDSVENNCQVVFIRSTGHVSVNQFVLTFLNVHILNVFGNIIKLIFTWKD